MRQTRGNVRSVIGTSKSRRRNYASRSVNPYVVAPFTGGRDAIVARSRSSRAAPRHASGRSHPAVGYWNTAFHHGQWLQTSVNRPEMVKFGGQFLPVHFVGLLAEGSVGSGGLSVRYHAGIGNGRGLNIARGGDAGDVNPQ